MSRVSVVTGANKGIGYGICKFLCSQFDGDVILTSRDTGRGANAVKQLNDLGLNAKYHRLDIDDTNSIVALRDFLLHEYGGCDVLVNNAAIAYKMDSDVPDIEQAENTIKINYYSTLNVCHVLFPILKPHARVVNVSSSAGVLRNISSESLRNEFSDPNLTEEKIDNLLNRYLTDVRANVHRANGWTSTSYAMSKVALSALTFIQQRQFNTDSREDIVINAVHPGYVDTDMTSHKGPLTIEQGADAPTYCALLPPNVTQPKGDFVWNDRKVIDWFKV